MSNKILIAYFSHAGDNYVGGRIVNLAVRLFRKDHSPTLYS
jgi:hypothetical protein